ncbi:LysE family translocator [Amycolatopsis sp. OK19-0408]|uniref:LysE family translocator n=1 Tax=Amycolatopsis iheyensis TaxID=2945988 RepID=A0A9X2N6N8_9PSEU|nr:LysE family translocator [Amycolatopsis iheyensis]MCR6481828.1 LysE family translocator [Amycolatopsis iheyensis]
MTWGTYGAYVLFVVLVLIVPGPDTALVLKNSLAGGRRGGVLTALGIGSGNLVQGVAAALGLSALVVRSEPVFLALKWAGAAYLGYLGGKALVAAWRGNYRALERAAPTGGRRWREGFLGNLTNPKVLVFYLSMLPQFLTPDSTLAESLLLAGTVGVLATLWQLVIVAGVHRIRHWLRRRRVRRTMDGVTGAALLGFGAALVVEG